MKLIHYFLVLFTMLVCLWAIKNTYKVQANEMIQVSSKYVGGHTYLIFNTTNSISVVHDESCMARSHSK